MINLYTKPAGLLLLLTVLAGICCPAEGQIKNVTLGWQGQCKLGYWTPAQFEYEGELPADFAVEFTLPDTDGVPVVFVDRSPRVEMRSGRKWIQTVVKLGRSRGQVLVRLLSEKNEGMGKEIASSQSRLEAVCTPVDSLVEMFVSVGRSIEMNSGVAIGGNVDYASPVAVVMENADFLPETSIAYESINGLVLEISGLFEKPLPKGVQVALRDWVFKGGRLAITGGENLAGFFAAHPVLASIQSVKFSAAKPLDSTDTLERVLKADSRIPDDRGRLVVAVVDEFEGDVLLEEDSRPIVVRKNVAFGVVVLVTVNLADDPLASWSDRKKLTGQVVSILVDSGNDRNRSELRGGRAGYKDLSGQLRTALDHFSGVSAVNFTVVAAIAILFICLIGPADYLFLKKIVKRMEWTWVSFLALVLLACGSIYLIHKSTKPDSLACRQVEIVDIDVATNRARGTVWAHLYSPASQKYDIDWVTGETMQRDQRSGSWFGFPGTALGGMDNQSTNTSQSSRYSIDLESRAVQAMPVNVAATKGLQLDWSGKPVSEFKQELKAN
ncbi:MAG: hypothetical protein VX768_15340, partial [Planctomycetota bacterium]|nr:hypothetical protein [Planctomycetota bacterium]